MRYPQTAALLLVALVLAGCGANSPVPGKQARPPKLPPGYPAAQRVALDPALRQAAVLQIQAGAGNGSAVLRAHALEAAKTGLGAMSGTLITQGLADQDGLVRFAACMAAGDLKLSAARPTILLLADDTDMNVRMAARFALHRMGDVSQSHDFEKFARSLEPQLRANTVLILGLLGEPSALKILRVMRKDTDPAVRLQVAESMWRLGDKDGLEALVGYTISRYPDDQMVAVLALAGPRDLRAREHIRGLLVTDYTEVNLVAARALGMLSSDEGYGVAMQGAASVDARQRYLAALAFGAIGRADAQSILSPLLQDADADVRLAAASAILQLR